jgi:hypothetical protein
VARCLCEPRRGCAPLICAPADVNLPFIRHFAGAKPGARCVVPLSSLMTIADSTPLRAACPIPTWMAFRPVFWTTGELFSVRRFFASRS